jgi:hypothetical protein
MFYIQLAYLLGLFFTTTIQSTFGYLNTGFYRFIRSD